MHETFVYKDVMGKRKMRRLVFIFTILTSEIFACGGAYQLRLFPIGIADNKIIVIETSLHRYSGPDTLNEAIKVRDRWKGTIKLFSVNKKGESRLIQQMDTLDFSDSDYVSELKRSFKKAAIITQTIPGFIKADKQEIEYCNYKKSCISLSIKTDTLTNRISVTTKDKKNISIDFPNEIIRESDAIGGIQSQYFNINSTRVIRIGYINLIVVDFATGEEHNTDFQEQTKKQEQCTSPIDCIYPEIVLHHGLSFDKMIWD